MAFAARGDRVAVHYRASAERADLPAVVAGTRLSEPRLEKFDDMQHLILLDPVHEIDETMGWPRIRAAE